MRHTMVSSGVVRHRVLVLKTVVSGGKEIRFSSTLIPE